MTKTNATRAQSFGAVLRRLRTTAPRMTQRELAQCAGLAKHVIESTELGRYVPSDAAIEKLAQALCVPAHVLFHIAGRATPAERRKALDDFKNKKTKGE